MPKFELPTNVGEDLAPEARKPRATPIHGGSFYANQP